MAGSRLRDRYDVVRAMKSGAMGAVFEATNGFMRLAVKFPTVDLVDRDLVDRFKREADALSRISNRHVVRIVEMDKTEDGRDTSGLPRGIPPGEYCPPRGPG